MSEYSTSATGEGPIVIDSGLTPNARPAPIGASVLAAVMPHSSTSLFKHGWNDNLEELTYDKLAEELSLHFEAVNMHSTDRGVETRQRAFAAYLKGSSIGEAITGRNVSDWTELLMHQVCKDEIGAAKQVSFLRYTCDNNPQGAIGLLTQGWHPESKNRFKTAVQKIPHESRGPLLRSLMGEFPRYLFQAEAPPAADILEISSEFARYLGMSVRVLYLQSPLYFPEPREAMTNDVEFYVDLIEKGIESIPSFHLPENRPQNEALLGRLAWTRSSSAVLRILSALNKGGSNGLAPFVELESS